MGFKAKLCVSLLLLSLVALCALATKDPQLRKCKHQCQEGQFDPKQQRDCERKCEEFYKGKEEKQREGRGRQKEDGDEWSSRVDPEKKLRECQRRCESYQGRERQQCRVRCQEKQEREREREGDDNRSRSESKEEEERGERNPYVFEEEHFTTSARTEHGKFDVLQRFNKRSKLLRGLENYRIGVLVANPQTFIVPNHVDAEGLYFVAKGRATVTKVLENKRESHNLETGDLLRVHSGTPTYLINRDENEKLYIIKLFKPVNIPDKFEIFYGAGGENPESFFRTFSAEILEAALKTDRSRLERIFRQQTEGPILKASREQIQALSQHEESHRSIWPLIIGESGDRSLWPLPTGDGSQTSRRSGPVNLFRQRPTVSNDYGELFEVDSNDFRSLEELNVKVSFANISRGSMSGPFFNSKATKIAIVTQGEGYFEMACHVSGSGSSWPPRRRGETKVESRRGESSQTYQQIKSRLRVGTVFVVPAGHPIATVASRNNNLQVLCFEVNAEGNVRYPLAGRDNIVRQMEREAKELAFNVRAQEVDQVFGLQNLKLFFPGPEQQKERGRRAYE